MQHQSLVHHTQAHAGCILHTAAPRGMRQQCRAGKGFGDKASSVKSRGKKDRQAWTEVARLDEFRSGRPIKPVTLPSNNIVMLYRYGDQVFCTAPNSTAYQFPLSDARIHERGGKPAIEVPLDGTVYDLRNGQVLEWCPKNNPVRWVLGSLKGQAQQEPLQVFPVEIDDGSIFVKFA